MTRRGWAVRGTAMDSAGNIVKCYRGCRSRWTLDVADVRWFDSRAHAALLLESPEADSTVHWAVVPESEVMLHLTTRALTGVDDS